MVNVNLDNLRRQFPEEISVYFSTLVDEKFAAIQSQITDAQNNATQAAQKAQEALSDIEDAINSAAEQATEVAYNTFTQQAASGLVEKVKPEIKKVVIEELKKGIFNAKDNTQRLKTYVDTQNNIDAIQVKDENTLYYGKEG